MTDHDPAAEDAAPQWKPLSPRARRVVGVLVEKAKTTPDAYPLSLNALISGCNQKSNRQPQMSLDSDDVEDELEVLREAGVVTELQGMGRVVKYRHHMYEWLGVDKYEIAVMTELLLRGEQSLGDLRGRASRMEQIASLDALRPIINSLKAKKLLIELTPPGRGQLVTHGLLTDREMVEMQRRFGDMPAANASPAAPAAIAPAAIAPAASAPASSAPASSAPASSAPSANAPAASSPASTPAGNEVDSAAMKLLQDEVEMQRTEIDEMQKQIGQLETQLSDLTAKMDALLS